MIRNAITAKPFDVGSFRELLIPADAVDSPDRYEQVSYLARYCRDLGAKTIVIERHYVDRHFLDEYALYYSRNLDPPPSNSVKRVHLFASRFTDEELGDVLESAGTSIEDQLKKDYLGFIAVRPVPAVPIGRTVLRRLDGEDRRIWATGPQYVHLANLPLEVQGLPFQQQDLAVGACATAAVWSALSRAARREGMRAPTPAEVSDSASRHLLTHGRTLPAASAGLTVEQVCEAIRGSGFAPEVARAEDDPELMIATIHTYLNSGIPVVLSLLGESGGHAVTAAGFQCGTTPDERLQSTINVRSARLSKLYVHDDRLGPYARAHLHVVPRTTDTETDEEGNGNEVPYEGGVFLSIGVDSDDSATLPQEEPQIWQLVLAQIPVYPKLRLSAGALLALADAHADVLSELVGDENAVSLEAEMEFARAGEYLSKLHSRASPSADFMRAVALSRWSGVVRWFVGGDPLVEIVYDTTDVFRDEHTAGAELVRAVVCLDQPFRDKALELAEFFEVPLG